MMDSIPLVCITGQVPTHLIGNDAFQECDTVGITRPCTKHNWLVRDVNDLARVLHEAFYVATTGRPGPVVVDIPKDVQFAKGTYYGPKEVRRGHTGYRPPTKGSADAIRHAVAHDGAAPSGRSSIRAAASSIPGRRRASSCASWWRRPAFPSRRR